MIRSMLRPLLLAMALVLGATGAAWADSEVTTANSSDDVEAKSGDAESKNSTAIRVGHDGGEGDTDVEAEDIDNDTATNVQEGDNEVDASQSATSSTGAAVTGQVIGGVSSGTLAVDATNATTDSEATTGDATSENEFAAFVGLDASTDTAIAADVLNGDATNVQEGDNSVDLAQSSDAVTGDAVAGQILGAVAGGPMDIVLANTSDDSSAQSGDADERSEAATFTGLAARGVIDVV